VLGQVAVAVAEGSNEIPAIPELLALLALLALRGCIVTIGCQTAIAGAVAAQGADSAITLKEHQGNLFAEMEAAFADLDAGAMAYRHTGHREVDTAHRWLGVRITTLLDNPALLAWLNPAAAWAGLGRAGQPGAGGGRAPHRRPAQPRDPLLTHQPNRRPHRPRGGPPPLGQAPRRSGDGTASTGCSAWPSARTTAASGSATAPGTLWVPSPSCVDSPSTCSAGTPPPRYGIKDRRLIAALDPVYLLALLRGSF